MTQAPYFHVGILVPNLDEAMRRFSKVLGLEFAEPTVVRVPDLHEDGKIHSFDVYLTYSKQGPPHIELLEARGDGAYGLHHGIGLHHIGAWCDDIQMRIAELEQLHVKPEAIFRNGDEVLGVFFRPAAMLGMRYELSPMTIKPGWEAWLAGGESFL